MTAVSAAPSNAPSAQTLLLSCDPNDHGIDTITAIVIENDGSWSPGHIVAINGDPTKKMGIPVAFQGTVTDSSGAVVAEFLEVKPGNRNGIGDTLQCTETESFTDDQDTTFTLTLTVTLFIAPRA